MIPIKKSLPPKVLIDYRRNKNANFNDFSGKPEIIDSLITEQYGLCAYCMSRISNAVSYKDSLRLTHCKIEHFKSQSNYPDLQLEYKNMLGCCNGNEGAPFKYQTCDTHKGNSDLLFNPADENDCKKMDIKFYKDGTIHSGNSEFDKQLNSVLNLNSHQLISERKALLDAVFHVLNRYRKSRTNKEIQRLINVYEALENGNHRPFYYVAIYYLKKHLR